MCFNSSPTSDDSPSLTEGVRDKLLQFSVPKRDRSKKSPRSRLPSTYVVESPETSAKVGAKVDGVRKPESLAGNVFNRSEPSADTSAKQKAEAPTKIEPSSSSKSDSESATIPAEQTPKRNINASVLAVQFVAKVKSKKVKGMITGMGQEIKRAASTVGDTANEKISNPTKKKKKKGEKEREELLGDNKSPKPHVRNPEEIKKKYGHSIDAKSAAGMANQKLRERGDKLSALQRRTSDLEADAASFSSLAGDLAKKMETKKWYEI